MPDELPDLEIAIEGQGVSLESVDIKCFGAFILSLRKFISAIASPRLAVSVVGLAGKSHDTILASKDPTWAGAIGKMIRIAHDGGVGLDPRATDALIDLYRKSKTIGPRVGFRPYDRRTKTEGDFVEIKEPVALGTAWLKYTTTIYGRVIGLHLRGDGKGYVDIKPSDGRTLRLTAELEVLNKAHPQFKKTVRARIEASPSPGGPILANLLDVEGWQAVDLVGALMQVRGKFEEEGIDFDLENTLREIDD